MGATFQVLNRHRYLLNSSVLVLGHLNVLLFDNFSFIQFWLLENTKDRIQYFSYYTSVRTRDTLAELFSFSASLRPEVIGIMTRTISWVP